MDISRPCFSQRAAYFFSKFGCLAVVAVLLLSASSAFAQKDSLPPFTELRLRVRADLNYHHLMNSTNRGDVEHLDDNYAFTGKYFVLRMGGNIGKHFSYFFRHNIVPHTGSVKFFDNTDMLYLNYHINDQWSFRFGKDALAVGGFEYDLPAIEVLYSGYYWNQFYCFQLAASAAYHTKDNKHTLRLQVANSPYMHYGSTFGTNSLFSYNFLWAGNMGHFHTLYSVNMFQRDKVGHFMNYIGLGNRLAYDKWSLYLDLMHHANSTRQLMKNFGVVCRADYFIKDNVNLFIKASYEQNLDAEEWDYFAHTGEVWDCLAVPGYQYVIGGVGFEYRPDKCRDVKIHGFVADFCTENDWQSQTKKSKQPSELKRFAHDITANVGVTWQINFMKFMKK